MLVRKVRSGTSNTKACPGGLVRVALSWKSHRATCTPACAILYNVTGSCKGPIYKSTTPGPWQDNSILYVNLTTSSNLEIYSASLSSQRSDTLFLVIISKTVDFEFPRKLNLTKLKSAFLPTWAFLLAKVIYIYIICKDTWKLRIIFSFFCLIQTYWLCQ